MNENFVVVMLDNCSSVNAILIFILNAKRVGILLLICFKLVVIKFSRNGIMNCFVGVCKVASATNVANLLYRNALVKQKCNSAKDVFTHSIGENVGAGVNEN